MTTVKDRPRNTTPRNREPIIGRLVGLVVLVAACWVTLLAATPSPTGNPVLRTTSPGSAELVKSPDRVVLTFDRPVPAGLATVRILEPGGSQVVFERPAHPDGRQDAIAVPMPKKRYEGTYAVAWTMPSSQLDPISGTFTFDVFSTIQPEGVPEIETTHDTTVTAFYTAARAVAIAAMALLVGGVFFVAAIGPAAVRSRSVRRLVKYSWFGLVAATVGTFVSFGPYAAWTPLRGAFDPRLLSATFESDTGGALLARLYVLVPVTLGIAQLMTSSPAETGWERRLRGGTALACAAALLATWTLADPRPAGGTAPLALIMDIVLLTAVGLSIGGLVSLRVARNTERDVVSRFAHLAGWCAGMLVVAGSYQVWRGHGFGWLPAGAFALAALFVGAAFSGFAWTHREAPEGKTAKREKRAGQRRFRSLVAGTAGLAVLLVAGTATLVTVQSGQTAHAQGRLDPAPSAIHQQVAPIRLAFDTGKPGGQGSVDLVVIPAAQQNTVRLDTYFSVLGDTGDAKDDVTVTAVLNRPDHTAGSVPVRLSHLGTGYTTGSATLPEHGSWELALTLQAGDGSRQTVTQPIDVR